MKILKQQIISHIICIAEGGRDKRLSHGMNLCQVIMTFHFLNDIVNDVESSARKSIVTS